MKQHNFFYQELLAPKICRCQQPWEQIVCQRKKSILKNRLNYNSVSVRLFKIRWTKKMQRTGSSQERWTEITQRCKNWKETSPSGNTPAQHPLKPKKWFCPLTLKVSSVCLLRHIIFVFSNTNRLYIIFFFAYMLSLRTINIAQTM